MIQDALKTSDFSEDALILARAASIIRKDIFNHEGILFNGSFPEKCQDTSLPSSLKTLISLILNGSNLKNQEKQESQACLTIGQAIVFNAKKRSTADPEAKPRHSLAREPPLPVYIGLNIHGLTRSKHLSISCTSWESAFPTKGFYSLKIGLPKQYAYVLTRTQLYPLSACTEVCLPLVLCTVIFREL